MLYTTALTSAPFMLLANSQLRRPAAKFFIARSAAYSHMKISIAENIARPYAVGRKSFKYFINCSC